MSGPQFIECEQNSPEWFAARAGIPTASEFKTIIGIKKDAKDKLTRAKYMRKLAGEILTGEVIEGYKNTHMERGHIMEDEARSHYAFMANVEPTRVGFVRNGNTGCSPDSLIGHNGILEIKTAFPDILIEKIEANAFPPEHRWQCQGNLWIAERDFVDLKIYWPRMPNFVKRSYRNEQEIKTISDAVDQFNDELAELVERLRRLGSDDARRVEQPIQSIMAAG